MRAKSTPTPKPDKSASFAVRVVTFESYQSAQDAMAKATSFLSDGVTPLKTTYNQDDGLHLVDLWFLQKVVEPKMPRADTAKAIAILRHINRLIAS